MAPPHIFDRLEAAGPILACVENMRRAGVAPGDRVAVCCRDPFLFAVARQAVARAGALGVPVHPGLTADETDYILGHARPALILADHRIASDVSLAEVPREGSGKLPPAAGPRPETIGATIIYTSGTTGQPKGCLRTAEQECARAREIAGTYGLTSADVQLIASPLAHSAPGIFARAHFELGGQTILLSGFDAEAVLRAIEAHRVTFFFMVPTQYARLCALPAEIRDRFDRSSVRAAIVAGAPCAPALKKSIIELFGPVLWEFYGSSETGTIAVLPPDQQLGHPWSAGRPLESVVVEIRDPNGAPVSAGQAGEIFVRSPTLMAGYLAPGAQRPDPLPADGFLSVGDLGRLDEDGHLHLIDRVYDTIITGGVNVYPAEVERVLLTHPEVDGAVIFGIADPDWGEKVVGYYAGSAEPEALRTFLRQHLAGFKCPKEIRRLDLTTLPLTPSGKPLRRAARERWLKPAAEAD